MSPITPVITQFLEDRDIEWTRLSGFSGDALHFSLSDDEDEDEDDSSNYLIRIDEDDRSVTFYALCSAIIPDEKRSAVMELVTRANFDLVNGNFELDLERGKVRFKTAIHLKDDDMTDGLFNSLLGANITSMDSMVPVLKVVLLGEAPATALPNFGDPNAARQIH